MGLNNKTLKERIKTFTIANSGTREEKTHLLLISSNRDRANSSIKNNNLSKINNSKSRKLPTIITEIKTGKSTIGPTPKVDKSNHSRTGFDSKKRNGNTIIRQRSRDIRDRRLRNRSIRNIRINLVVLIMRIKVVNTKLHLKNG